MRSGGSNATFTNQVGAGARRHHDRAIGRLDGRHGDRPAWSPCCSTRSRPERPRWASAGPQPGRAARRWACSSGPPSSRFSRRSGNGCGNRRRPPLPARGTVEMRVDRIRRDPGASGATRSSSCWSCRRIVLILASAAMPLARVTATRQREAELRRALREMRTAIDKFKDAADAQQIASLDIKAGSEGYPADLETLVDGVAGAQRRDRPEAEVSPPRCRSIR